MVHEPLNTVNPGTGHRDTSGLPEDGKVAYSVVEAARLIGVGKNQLYDSIGAGNFPGYRIGHRIVVPRAALARWLAGEWQPESRNVTPLCGGQGRRAS
jgi:excisionase family DNA binding protein